MSKPRALSLETRLDTLTLNEPFRISGHLFESAQVLNAVLSQDGARGRGEAAGVYYTGDTPQRMLATLDGVRGEIEAGIDRAALRDLLPSGGARNAVDAALWELEANLAGCAVWQLAGLEPPRPLLTTMTIGADDPGKMAADARGLTRAKAIKLKLTGEADLDIERVRAVRKERPDVWIGVDANQGFSRDNIGPLIPVLMDCKVSLLEQPFARGREEDMRGMDFPLPTAADESCLDLSEVEALAELFDVINIKLDKCGGLTEGLMLAARARELGLKVMVGCMFSGGLATATGFVLGQLCDVVDLDGPISLVSDVSPTVDYTGGLLFSPPEVWGGTPRP
jgi:L-alanine-DL-glutamate epimerase-like enolase superfamily enzyme